MSLDFTPRPGAAPAWSRILAHGRTEARLILSNAEQHILTLVIPIGLLVAGRFFGDRFGFNLATIAPSVLALAIWSTAFTAIAISTGFERRYNVLERLAATPLGKPGILLGKALAIGVIVVLQVVVLTAVALLLGWRPELHPGHILVGACAVLVAIAAFSGLALCLAGTARPEITLAVANLVYLIGAMVGIMIPLSLYPSTIRPIVAALPTTALGDALRFGVLWSLPVLLIWAIAALLIARKVFTWTS